VRYRERLYPSIGVFLALSLGFPMLLLAAMPFGLEIGLTVSIIGTASLFGFTFVFSPVIEVDQELRVGRFRIPLKVIGNCTQLNNEELKLAIGVNADARAQLLIRGYIKTGLKIEINDPEDPTPHVIVSTRRPAELAVALLANRS
jgi:hypothetical protein